MADGAITNLFENYEGYQIAKARKKQAELKHKLDQALWTAYSWPGDPSNPQATASTKNNAIVEATDLITKLQHPELAKEHRGTISRILHGIGGGLVGAIGGPIMAGAPNPYAGLPVGTGATPASLARSIPGGDPNNLPQYDPNAPPGTPAGNEWPMPQYTPPGAMPGTPPQFPTQIPGADTAPIAGGATASQLAGQQQAAAEPATVQPQSLRPPPVNIPQPPDIRSLVTPIVPASGAEAMPSPTPATTSLQQLAGASAPAPQAPTPTSPAVQNQVMQAIQQLQRQRGAQGGFAPQQGRLDRPGPQPYQVLPNAPYALPQGAMTAVAPPDLSGSQPPILGDARLRPGGPRTPQGGLSSTVGIAGLSPGSEARPDVTRMLGGVSPQANLDWARMSMLYAGPQGQQAFQLQQIMDDMQRRGVPKDQQDAILSMMTGGRSASTTRASIEQQTIDDAIAAQESHLGRKLTPQEKYDTEIQAQRATASTKQAGTTEQGLQHALAAGAQKLGKVKADGTGDPSQLTDAEWGKIYEQFRSGEAGDPLAGVNLDAIAAAQAQLAPGQKNEVALAGQPANIVSLVKQLDDYVTDIPGGIARTRPPYNIAIPLTSLYDPNWSESEYPTRLSVKKDFASGGNTGKNLIRINTLVAHLGSMSQSGAALQNIPSGTYGPATSTANWLQKIYREHSQDPRLKTFIKDANAVNSELAAIFKGTGAPAEKEIQSWRDNVDAASSPEEIKADVQEGAKLMIGRLTELQDRWEHTMGTPFRAGFLSAESLAALRRILPGVSIPGIDTAIQPAPTGPAPVSPAGAAGRSGAPAAANGVRNYDPNTGMLGPPQ